MLTWATRKTHVSWLIAGASIGWVIGVWSALYTSVGELWALGGAIISLGMFVLRKRYAVVVVGIAMGLVGCWYGSASLSDAQRLSPLIGEVVTLTGTVREDPSLGGGGDMSLQLNRLRIGEHTLSGAVWVSLGRAEDIVRGDEVTLKGRLTAGFGNFVGTMYRASVREIVRPVPGDLGRVVRDWFADAVRLGIPEPQASLGIGFLTGQKSALPEELSEQLRIAGLTHIVVASGYNLTILVRLARRLFKKYSQFLATTSSMAMIISFIAVTGLSPSMTRAGLVSSFSLVAANYGRSIHPFVLLPFIAAITVAWQPSFVWGDLGWQLSMTAFAGVMIVAPLMQAYFFGSAPPGLLRQIFGETVAAHLVTLPLIVLSFGLVSHVAIIANLLIVPLVPLAMLLTFIVGIVGLVAPAIVAFVALPASWLLTYMTTVAGYLADVPWAQADASDIAWAVPLYIVGLVICCWYMQRKTKLQLREVNIVD